MSNANDVNRDHKMVDPINDSILAASCRVKAGKLVTQRLSNARRILGKRAIAEGENGPCNCGGKCLEITECATGERDLEFHAGKRLLSRTRACVIV